jgi:hypothetical protein
MGRAIGWQSITKFVTQARLDLILKVCGEIGKAEVSTSCVKFPSKASSQRPIFAAGREGVGVLSLRLQGFFARRLKG